MSKAQPHGKFAERTSPVVQGKDPAPNHSKKFRDMKLDLDHLLQNVNSLINKNKEKIQLSHGSLAPRQNLRSIGPNQNSSFQNSSFQSSEQGSTFESKKVSPSRSPGNKWHIEIETVDLKQEDLGVRRLRSKSILKNGKSVVNTPGSCWSRENSKGSKKKVGFK